MPPTPLRARSGLPAGGSFAEVRFLLARSSLLAGRRDQHRGRTEGEAGSHAWISAVDNHGSDPARIWFFRNLSDPTVVRPPLVLKKPDGTPYTGITADDEGLAVLPNGNYLVSSETEPSIRIYSRAGLQLESPR